MGVFADICAREASRVDRRILEDTLKLAVELAREGREGRKIGALFVVGDEQAVLAHSRPMILDPLQGHPPEHKHVGDPQVRETLEELALLDGAFVISAEGVALSAARYIDVVARDIEVPLGLGSRHIAAASVSRVTRAIAVVVSTSSIVRVFADGHVVSEVIPELWMLDSYAHGMTGASVTEKADHDVTVVTRRD